jgi:hypothetical protein
MISFFYKCEICSFITYKVSECEVILYSSHQYTRTILNTYLVGKNMKMSSISLIFIMTIVFFQSVEVKGASQCYYCYYTCQEPLQVETCFPGYDTCISAKDPTGSRLKGCVNPSDPEVVQSCEIIDNQSDSYCFMCDSDFCNSATIYSLSGTMLLSLIILLKLF